MERRMRERSFLDSESPKRAPCAKLNWVLNLGAARRRVFCVRDVEDFVGVRKETKFYSERRLYSLPEYKTLHEEKEERKT